MNISQLRETITELLSASPNLIGTYTLPNASTLPAVYVVGRQSVPKEWKVKGAGSDNEGVSTTYACVSIGGHCKSYASMGSDNGAIHAKL
jgi:hypothetical protein